MLEWQLSWAFWLLLAPLIIILLPATNRNAHAIMVPFYQQFTTIVQRRKSYNAVMRIAKFLGIYMLWSLLVVSAAQPTWIGEPVDLPASGRDLLLAVDISGSMDETDMPSKTGNITRIDALKNVLGKFITRREGDRIGLILFGEQAYMQTPLTFDRKTVNKQLDEAQIGFAGRSTAIGDAIGLGTKRLLERDKTLNLDVAAKDKVIILLTDGANTAGTSPLTAAGIAAEEGVKIYTIGIGAEVLTRSGIFGLGSRQVKNTELDERTLTSIAGLTGGIYYRARNPKELNQIYSVIDDLEPIPEQLSFRPQRQLFHWPLGIFLAISLGIALSMSVIRWWRR